MSAARKTVLVIPSWNKRKTVRTNRKTSKRDRITSLQFLHLPIGFDNMLTSLGRMFLNMLPITNMGQRKDDTKSHEETMQGK